MREGGRGSVGCCFGQPIADRASLLALACLLGTGVVPDTHPQAATVPSRMTHLPALATLPSAGQAYRVTGAGLEVQPEVAAPLGVAGGGSVVHQAIANEVQYEQQQGQQGMAFALS